MRADSAPPRLELLPGKQAVGNTGMAVRIPCSGPQCAVAVELARLSGGRRRVQHEQYAWERRAEARQKLWNRPRYDSLPGSHRSLRTK